MSDSPGPLDDLDAAVRVIAIVLNYNRPDDTIACVRTLVSLRGQGCEILVVDNGSSDDSVTAVRSAHPAVPVVVTGRNLGFGGGMNAGIRWAMDRRPDFIWLLNNDTLVDPDALQELLAVGRADPRLGIIGSVIVDMDDPARVQTWGGGHVNLWTGATTRFDRPRPGRLDHIVGVSMFIRRGLLEQLSGFSPCYRFYLEDTDLSCEARRRGWKLAVAPRSVIRHRLGGTIGSGRDARSVVADVLHAWGIGVFIARQSGPRAFVAVPVHLAGMIARRVQRGQAGRIPSLARAFAGGIVCGYLGDARASSAGLDLA
jgi:GT2 family glycosyltransferase